MTSTRSRPTAIVTGASSGIGRATALALAERGYDLGLAYRARADEAAVTAAAARDRGAVVTLRQIDLSRPAEAGAATAELAAALGGVDALVNNAGISPRAHALEQPLSEWTTAVDVLLTGPFACAQAAARSMVAERGGSIVNVTSLLDSIPLAEAGAYCAAKAGLAMITRVLALELAGTGVRVNAVAPGHTATPMNYGDADLETVDRSWAEIPVGRSADPREVAAAVAFLVSPESSYLTGANLLVDGGLSLVSGPTLLQNATGRPPAPALGATA